MVNIWELYGTLSSSNMAIGGSNIPHSTLAMFCEEYKEES
jgi:hypothetical protein